MKSREIKNATKSTLTDLDGKGSGPQSMEPSSQKKPSI